MVFTANTVNTAAPASLPAAKGVRALSRERP